MRIAICGIGPAGLFAAWAAREHDVQLFDVNVDFQPWRIFALQYLHAHCDLPVEARRELQLHYRIDGADGWTPDQIKRAYNYKVGRPLADVNSTRFAFEHPKTVFSLKVAYSFLYGAFKDRMVGMKLNAELLTEVFAPGFDLVISTVPLNILFPAWPLEVSQMWITQDSAPIELQENECVMNVDPALPWTRASRIDGGVATEYVKDVAKWNLPPGLNLQKLRKVIKPASYPELPKNVILAGRWGSWDPAPLSHDTYYRLSSMLE